MSHSSRATCERCGVAFDPPSGNRARGFGKYCSMACYHAVAHAPAVEKTCQTCGKPMRVRPSLVAKGKGKYCSRMCFDAAERVRGEKHPSWKGGPEHWQRADGGEKVCVGCGVTFRAQRKRIEYCSVACHHRHVKPKPTPGRRYLNAQGYIRLTLCDGSRVLEHRWIYEQAWGVKPKSCEIVHHLNWNKTDNRPENLILLSGQKAHEEFHRLIGRLEM